MLDRLCSVSMFAIVRSGILLSSDVLTLHPQNLHSMFKTAICEFYASKSKKSIDLPKGKVTLFRKRNKVSCIIPLAQQDMANYIFPSRRCVGQTCEADFVQTIIVIVFA